MAFIHKGACSVLPVQLALRARGQSSSVPHGVLKAGHNRLRGRAEHFCQPWPSSQAGLQLGPDEDRQGNFCKLTTQPVSKGFEQGTVKTSLTACSQPSGLPFPGVSSLSRAPTLGAPGLPKFSVGASLLWNSQATSGGT